MRTRNQEKHDYCKKINTIQQEDGRTDRQTDIKIGTTTGWLTS